MSAWEPVLLTLKGEGEAHVSVQKQEAAQMKYVKTILWQLLLAHMI